MDSASTPLEVASLTDEQIETIVGECQALIPDDAPGEYVTAVDRAIADAARDLAWHSRDAEVVHLQAQVEFLGTQLQRVALVEKDMAQQGAKYAALVEAGNQLWGFINGHEGAVVDNSWPNATAALNLQ